jgi:hypothetical protein
VSFIEGSGGRGGMLAVCGGDVGVAGTVDTAKLIRYLVRDAYINIHDSGGCGWPQVA